MLYYFVPDTTIFGGIKVAYQFVDALNALGVAAVIASPEVARPHGFTPMLPWSMRRPFANGSERRMSPCFLCRMTMRPCAIFQENWSSIARGPTPSLIPSWRIRRYGC